MPFRNIISLNKVLCPLWLWLNLSPGIKYRQIINIKKNVPTVLL